MESYATSATGRLRRTNEDAVLCEAVADGHVLAVCDGVGGHRAGAVASGIATTVIRTAIVDGLESGWPDPEDLLANALREAGEAIRHEATRHPQYRGMRTTAVVALVRDGAGFVAAVGDSRAYLVREELEQITTDHSLAAGAIDLGDRMPDGVAVHPFRHVVTQSLGMYGSVAPDYHEIQLDGGILLLCSDGLPNAVADDVILETVRTAPTIVAAAESLKRRASRTGGRDDITVVLAE